MELRHLRYFVAVAEELSFRRAAERLHVAQPPLSTQIKALEEELGVQLFERTTRSVRLTHTGRVFLDEARAVLSAAIKAESRAKSAHDGLTGTLRLGVIASAASSWLSGILRTFRQRYPGVQLSLYDLTSPEQLRRLRANELDAGVLRPPVTFPELDFSLIEETSHILAAPSEHRLAKKHKIEWKDFDGEQFVLVHPSLQHGYYDPFFAACARVGARTQLVQYANDIQTKLWLISSGFGIAPTSATLAEIHRPGLVFRRIPPGLPPVQTVLVWRRNDDSPPLVHFRSIFGDSVHRDGLAGIS